MKNLKELRKETIKKLEEVKGNLINQDDESNYCDMINTMIDYDNEAQDDLYLYDRCREMLDIVDDETLQYYLDYQFKNFGMERVPYIFANVNYSASIYKVNGYDNLENVNNDDFEYCIDEAIDTLKDAINED